MRTILAILLCSALALGSLRIGEDESTMRDHFDMWQHYYRRSYLTQEEKEARFQVFRENHLTILNHNAQEYEWTLGHNVWSDLTDDEWRKVVGITNYPITQVEAGATKVRGQKPMGAGVDWQKQGKVSKVKDQAGCGACWAFADAAATESYIAIQEGNTPIDLSVQQLLDCCDNEYCSGGCEGGAAFFGLKWISENGLDLWENYADYSEQKNACAAKTSIDKSRIFKHYGYLESDYEGTMAMVERGPLVIGIQADALKLFRNGVVSFCWGDLNHGVLLVGYGTNDSGTDYWKFKNSWGTDDWGKKNDPAGYGFIKRSSDGTGTCGELTVPVFPCATEDCGNQLTEQIAGSY